MTPTVTPFHFQGAYSLQSGNRLTINIEAERDRSSEDQKLKNIKVEYTYHSKESKDDVKEARHHLKEALSECGLQLEDVEHPKGK